MCCLYESIYWFESFANQKSTNSLGIPNFCHSVFESFVNPEEYQTGKKNVTESVSLRAFVNSKVV